MKCIICGEAMYTKRENYQYTASGLPHVTLQQVEVSRCPHCGETEVTIPWGRGRSQAHVCPGFVGPWH